MANQLASFDPFETFESIAVRRKVGVVEFAESDEFCNKPLYPRQRLLLKLIFLEELTGEEEDILSGWIRSSNEGGDVLIVPKIRERIDHLRELDYPHFTTAQLVLGRRAGKGTMTGIALTKKLYDLTQLDDPQAYYGVSKGESLYVSIIADSEDQAKRYQFKDARNTIVDCKALERYTADITATMITINTPADLLRASELTAKGVGVGSTLASLKVATFAKNARTIRGNASVVVVIDEMAHLTPGESHISDAELYKAIEPSLTQFGSKAILFANSSPWTKTGMFYKMYEQSQQLNPPHDGAPVFPSHFMIQAPSWEMYQGWEEDKKIQILLKEPSARPPALDPSVDFELAQKEKADPQSFRIEYRAQFGEVVNAYLDPLKVDQAYSTQYHRKVLGRSIQTEYAGTVRWEYAGHGDPSRTGANFGLAIGHVEMVNEVVETRMGDKVEMMVPHVVFDLVDAFYPEDWKETHTVDYLEVVPEIFRLIKNFRPREFTFDQFNSAYPIDQLNDMLRKGNLFETQVYEVTATAGTNRKRWDNFKAALNLGRVHIPNPKENQKNERALSLSRNEFKFLQEKNGKVDHQVLGPVRTKDIADCIAQVTHSLIGESLSSDLAGLNEAEMALGGHYGYSIGGRMTPSDPLKDWYDQPSFTGKYGGGTSPTRGGRGGRFGGRH